MIKPKKKCTICRFCDNQVLGDIICLRCAKNGIDKINWKYRNSFVIENDDTFEYYGAILKIVHSEKQWRIIENTKAHVFTLIREIEGCFSFEKLLGLGFLGYDFQDLESAKSRLNLFLGKPLEQPISRPGSVFKRVSIFEEFHDLIKLQQIAFPPPKKEKVIRVKVKDWPISRICPNCKIEVFYMSPQSSYQAYKNESHCMKCFQKRRIRSQD